MMLGTVVLTRKASWARPYSTAVSESVRTRPMRSETSPQNGAKRKSPSAIEANATPKIQSGSASEM